MKGKLATIFGTGIVAALSVLATSWLTNHGARRSTTLALVSLFLGVLATAGARRWIGSRGVSACFVGLAALAYPMGRVLGRYVDALRDLAERGKAFEPRFLAMPTPEWRLDTFYGSGNWRSIEKVAFSWGLVAALTTAAALVLPRRAIIGLALVATLSCAIATGASRASDRIPHAYFFIGLASALTATVLLAPLVRRRQRDIVGQAPYRAAVMEAPPDPSLHVRAAIALTVALYGGAPLLRLLSERALWR